MMAELRGHVNIGNWETHGQETDITGINGLCSLPLFPAADPGVWLKTA